MYDTARDQDDPVECQPNGRFRDALRIVEVCFLLCVC